MSSPVNKLLKLATKTSKSVDDLHLECSKLKSAYDVTVKNMPVERTMIYLDRLFPGSEKKIKKIIKEFGLEDDYKSAFGIYIRRLTSEYKTKCIEINEIAKTSPTEKMLERANTLGRK